MEAYFEAMERHDWATLRACLAEEFSRRGPYEEHAWDDPDSYVTFLRDLLPSLTGQRVQITESFEAGDRVQVNVTETIVVDGAPHSVRVAATFELDRDGRIAKKEVFVRRLTAAERRA